MTGVQTCALPIFAICVELGKRKNGSNYKAKKLAHEDEDLTDEQQQEFFHESNKARNIFIGFLIFSVAIATLSGSRNSYLFAVSSVQEQIFIKEAFVKEGYDAALQNAVVMAQKNHDAAIKSDRHDISSHRKALRNYNEAVENNETHKKEVDERNAKSKAEVDRLNEAGQKKTDDYNKSQKKDGHNDGVIYAIGGFIVSLIVEFFSVFYLFAYIEASYETYKSIKNNAQIIHEEGQAANIVINDRLQNADLTIVKNQSAAPTLSIDDEETMLLARLAALQQKKP